MNESTAKYRRIADILRERIRRRQYKVGETIPSYPELCTMFAVSDITVRKAVALLASENLLRMERGRGKGFFVNPPELRGGSGRPALRRLCFLPAGPPESDDPAIQSGVLSAADAGSVSLTLLPQLPETERAAFLKEFCVRGEADGLLINSQLFRSEEEAFEITGCLDEKEFPYVVIFSAECAGEQRFLERRHPGVYTEEHSALEPALRRARKNGRRRLLFLGVDAHSVNRSAEVARRAAGIEHFTLEVRLFSRSGLFAGLGEALDRERDAATTFVLEGNNLPLAYFDSRARERNLLPGRDFSAFFFEHYCAVDSSFFARYSSISRPYFDLGARAAAMLREMALNGAPGEPAVLRAAFNDLGTI